MISIFSMSETLQFGNVASSLPSLCYLRYTCLLNDEESLIRVGELARIESRSVPR